MAAIEDSEDDRVEPIRFTTDPETNRLIASPDLDQLLYDHYQPIIGVEFDEPTPGSGDPSIISMHHAKPPYR